MKNLVLKISVIAGIICVISVLIFNNDLKNLFRENEVYILFDVKEDGFSDFDWRNYAELFPKDFDPKRINVDVAELFKLDNKQKLKFDSISNLLYQYPRKIIYKENGIKNYSLSLSREESIGFKLLKESEISRKKISTLNIICIDSLIKLIYNSEYLSPKNKINRDLEFNIIEVENDKATLMKVMPYIIEHN